MKVITEPSVHVLSIPQFFPHPKYELPEFKIAADGLIAHAGKGCYDSYGRDGRSIADHIRGLISSRHGSVLEHANFSVFIEGVSRGLSHELVRHRAGFAFSQRSTRYTSEEEAAIVLDPLYSAIHKIPREDRSPEASALLDGFINGCSAAFAFYKEQLHLLPGIAPKYLTGTDLRKWCRGKARQLLPHALETRLTVTGNLRAWRHFFEQRSHGSAEPEIRRLAEFLMAALVPHFGVAISDYKTFLIDGIPEFNTDYRKV